MKQSDIFLRGGSPVGGGRFVGLDMLRIALALLIFLFHSHVQFECDYFVFNDFIRLGAISMTGFLMLSGYCLHLAYSKKDLTKLSEIKVFYLKRLITILPLYYFIALLYTIWGTSEGIVSMKENILLFPVETLCLQTIFSSLFTYTHNGGTWFVSCIIICYFIYPFLQTLLSQMGNKAKLYLACVLCGILLYAPFVEYAFQLQSIYDNPFFRLMEFTVGVIIAQINCSDCRYGVLKVLRSRYSLISVIIVFIVSVSIARHMGAPADYMLFNWIAIPCFVGLMIPLGTLSFSSIQNNKVLLYLSSISFTFFLCQIGPIWKYSGILCEIIGSEANFLKIAISFFYCLVGAVLIHELIEKPSAKYLRSKLLN